jgi:signal peptidase I
MSSSTVVKYGVAIFVACALALIAKFAFVARFTVPQDGMFPSIPAGSSFFLNRRAYANSVDVKRGDIVAIDWEKGGGSYTYVWRVVAVPGEFVELSGDALAVDGRSLEHTFLRKMDEVPIFRENNGNVAYEVAIGTCRTDALPITIKIPPEHFFVLADNRCGAEDSRVLGPIPFSAIFGKKI